MSELGIFHHSDLAATERAYNAQFADGPPADSWLGKYSATAHGDFPRWQTALQQLPQVEELRWSAQSSICIEGDLASAETQTLERLLREFMPWRKGPWNILGLPVTTEWQSDWKWQRLAPHLPTLNGQRILDVGCGNGYFGWQLLQAGAHAVLGVDPTLLFCLQHLVINRYARSDAHWVLPITFEALPSMRFDGALSLGVIYHRRDPLAHVQQLAAQLAPGGWLALESLVVTDSTALYPAKAPKQDPKHRYARMRNVWCVPTVSLLQQWLAQAGLEDIEVLDVSTTTVEEQRSTPWMTFESLPQCLDPADSSRTIEGYPAPVRAMLLARKRQTA